VTVRVEASIFTIVTVIVIVFGSVVWWMLILPEMILSCTGAELTESEQIKDIMNIIKIPKSFFIV
jgi:hypothetical protein